MSRRMAGAGGESEIGARRRRCYLRAATADGETGSASRRPGSERVETAAVAGDDAVELGQSLDLIDDDAAHLRGAFGGLLRQFENAAAQLGAGRLELLLHFAGHLLHALHDLGEAVGGWLNTLGLSPAACS